MKSAYNLILLGLGIFGNLNCSLATAANSGNFLGDSSERMSLLMSAVEATGVRGARAYQFIINCHRESCELRRTTYFECKAATDGKGAVMSIIEDSFSSEDGNLKVDRVSPQALRFRFERRESLYMEKFSIAISYMDDNAIPGMPLITSFSGLVSKTRSTDMKEQVVELRRSKRPFERLDRQCPIELLSR
ncbi:MAG: hypothetical protein JNJ95_01345 [Dechloromonas sp.]|nr:hypothetical protein [Dechloromonas sp.]